MEFKDSVRFYKKTRTYDIISCRICVMFGVGLFLFCPSAMSMETTVKGFRDCFDGANRLYYGSHGEACPRKGPCFPCLDWDEVLISNVSDVDYSLQDLSGSVCRFTNRADRYPRCYFMKNGNMISDWCELSPCTAHSGCMHGNGTNYRDAAMFTETGYECLMWADMVNQSVNTNVFPKAGLDKNFCRNPNNESRPWCYYNDNENNTQWDYCPIKQCETNSLSMFIRSVQTYISGYNRKYILGSQFEMTAERCANACLEEASFVCRTFELREIWPHDNRTCIMTNESIYTLDLYKMPSLGPAIDLFTRIDTICDAYRAARIPSDCPLPLGVENGLITDTQITSSSFKENFEPFKARLNSNSSWMPLENNDSEWLQIVFPRRMLITGFITQGGGVKTPFWVESFNVQYSENGDTWWQIGTEFRANGEPDCIRTIILDRPVRATILLISPTVWNGSISMRIEVLGCLDNDCDLSAGIAGGTIRDTQLTSSTVLDSSKSPAYARINPYDTRGSGWMPEQSDSNQWLQVTLDYQWDIKKIVTQGCGDVIGEYWVTSFKVQYYTDTWTTYAQKGYTDNIFKGNRDQYTLVANILEQPISSRYIRLVPVTWHQHICLRFEVFGCRHRICSRRLGMESGDIKDDQISATSYYQYASNHPTRSRLHQSYCWKAAHVYNEEWLQIDLLNLHTVTGLITQGRGQNISEYFVKTYALYYESRYSNGDWRTYLDDDGTEKIFGANEDHNSEARNDFERSFVTSKLRIVPRSWMSSLACLRVEILGCLYEDIGDFCSDAALQYQGFCIGTVDNQEHDACDNIFAEGSQPITINGGSIQSFLRDSFNKLEVEDRTEYVIGLQTVTVNSNVTLQWRADGTPMTYSRFVDKSLRETWNKSLQFCVALDSDNFEWSTYPCDDLSNSRATLCQIDINECVTGKEACSDSCLNFPGNYTCACPEGLYMDDNHNCAGLCNAMNSGAPLQGKHRCFTHSTKTSYSQAQKLCTQQDLRVTTLEDYEFWNTTELIRELLSKETEHIWIQLDDDENNSHTGASNVTSSSSLEQLCATIVLPGVSAKSNMIESMECTDVASAVCVKEFDDIRCDDMWLLNTTAITDSTSSTGYIQSMNYPPWYNTGSTCFIHFIGPIEKVYRFRFLRMNLRRRAAIGKCHDALELSDYIATRNTFIHRGTYCGNRTGLVVISRSNDVKWTLSIGELTADMDFEIGLVALFETIECSKESCNVACDVNNTMNADIAGSFSSYNFPSTIPPFSRCHWIIEAKEGSFIKFHFTDFRVECIDAVHLLENVTHDRAHSQLGFDLANRQGICSMAPPMYISETSTLIVVYATELDATSHGFEANYSTQDLPGCGFQHTTAAEIKCHLDSAVIASMFYPKSYELPEETSWSITTSPGTYIEFTFIDFDVPSQEADCFPGRVKAFDSPAASEDFIAKYCNDNPPPDVVLSSKNALFMEFNPDSREMGAGFYAEYHARIFTPSIVHASNIDRGDETVCADGWLDFQDSCYSFYNTSKNLHWRAAERYCDDLGAHLVSIRNLSEVNFIQKMLVTDWFTQEPSTYIGLTDREEGHFVWIDGSPMSYTDWSMSQYETPDGGLLQRSQPDGDNLEDCTMIILDTYHSTANWHDVSCASREANQFICKETYEKSELKDQSIGVQFKGCGINSNIFQDLCYKYEVFTDPKQAVEIDELCIAPQCRIHSQSMPADVAYVAYLMEAVWMTENSDDEGARYLFQMDKSSDECGCLTLVEGERYEYDIYDCSVSVDGIIYYSNLIEDKPLSCPLHMVTCSNGECIHPTYVCSDSQIECNELYGVEDCDSIDNPNNDRSTPCSLGFQCDNGDCISVSFYCDFVDDCDDSSDEKYCTYRNCTEHEYRCDNGQCIAMDLVCNLVPDCIDGSEEIHCGKLRVIDEGSCNRCDNGQCIAMDLVCNLVPDCIDGSEEIHCDVCTGGFQCYDGSCLPKRAICDATKDCPGNHWEDEPQSCPYHEGINNCLETQLRCNNGECINESLTCMYDFDEFEYHRGCRDVTHLRFCEPFQCPLMTIKCPASYCIPLRYRCNDVIDCPGGEDEEHCNTFTCPGSYRCHDASYCVTQGELCDGVQQCPMGDDELFCDITCPEGCSCLGLSFECQNIIWDSSVAMRIPDTIRKLNLVSIRRRRSKRAIPSSLNVTIDDVLGIPLKRFLILADLDLSKNEISLLRSGTFADQTNLIRLSLSYNLITTLQHGTFIGLRLLKHLNLTGNPLTTVESGAFIHLHTLPEMDLSGMSVDIFPDELFMGLKSLRNLTLQSGTLNEIIPGAFAGLRALEEMDIRGNPLRKVHGDIFKGLDRLKHLKSDRYLFCCLIGDIESCIPEADQFSSCADLMRNPVLRVCIWLLGLSALVGNIFVILWRTKLSEDSRSKVQDYLILNLAVADLLMGVYMISIASADIYYRDVYILYADKWQSGVMCKLAGLLSTLSCELSLFILAVISMDRFWCISFAMKGKRLQLEQARYITAIAWIIAGILSIIPVVGLSYFGDDFYGRSSVCLALPLTSDRPPGWQYSVMLFLGVNFISFLIICFCYLNIYCTVSRTSKRMRRNKKRAAEIKMAARMAFIVATDFACWMPIFIMAILSMSGTVTLPGDVYAWTAVFILPLNSSLNPFLYTFSNINIRKNIGALIADHSTDTARESDRTLTSPLRTLMSVNGVPSRILLSEMGSRRDILLLKETDIRAMKDDLRQCVRHLHQFNVAYGEITDDMIMLENDKRDTWRATLLLNSKSGGQLQQMDGAEDSITIMNKNNTEIETVIDDITKRFSGESTV